VLLEKTEQSTLHLSIWKTLAKCSVIFRYDSPKQNVSSQQAFLDSIHAESKITQFVGTYSSVSFSSQTFIEEWFRYPGLQGSGSR
jgi:hypothetical protein